MPEGIEVEYYRRAAEAGLARPIAAVEAPDDWFLKGGTTAAELRARLVGQRFVDARRHGKLLVLDIDDHTTLGVRFGMTGRLIVDEHAIIEKLEYSSDRDDPAWDRFAVRFDDGGRLAVRDPRRLGGVELDPDVSRLGPDAATIGRRDLREALAGGTGPLKARLLDQSRLAGLGNLLTDEILWRAGLDPARPAGGLDEVELRRLQHHIRAVFARLTERGGSHMGDLQPHRTPGSSCPRDGFTIERRTIGGRTTYSCTGHQS